MSLLESPPVGHAVAGGTLTTGVATWLNLIPNEIGKLATLVGIVLSLVLIVMHIRKMRHDSAESELRRELLRLKIQKTKEAEADE